MRFQKAINLWAGNNIERLISGQLILQAGQWVYCGNTKASRFCGVTPSGVIVAAHPEGKEQVVRKESFQACMAHAKSRKVVR
jgi:hypothetical protein